MIKIKKSENNSKRKFIPKPIFITFILLGLSIFLFYSGVLDSLNQKKEINDLKLRVSNLEKKINEKNIEILNLKRDIDNKTSIIISLKNALYSKKTQEVREVKPSEYNSILLESLQWIEKIAFDGRKYPEILFKNDEEKDVLKKILESKIIPSYDNEILLSIDLSDKKNQYYYIECLVYRRVNLHLEKGGDFITRKYVVKKTQKGFEFVE
ncbi:hypothetical protein SAMN02745883_01928 [Caminicella sporogenes DSM 14501]|uniref:Uncharacterized protein n=1 Tax=Caminicella sporogenes DSM 14501 TaxID=1121266 RepID=A0A1M6S1W1_9FIRM|nr:hypothetical protein [Caminicella sporogenes]RKD27166.1 hypothetical protein BET04_09630 [Caminicella sporogenes]SHK38641.1 hypothetical protein SAMN02745883_01928 [Caminicella sporogenes DSM 14501]